MLISAQELVRRETEEGTGAGIELEVDRSGAQTGLKLWFADLGRSRSPIVHLRPTGLKRYEARLGFGNFAAETIAQIMAAEAEEKQLARALVRTIAGVADVHCGNQTLENWEVSGADFMIRAEKKGVADRFGDDALAETCRDLVTPLLAAMAELYGYDVIEPPAGAGNEPVLEGAIELAVIRRRERNPRNRLLCLRIHGSRCAVCACDPVSVYGPDVSILEVHHIQPLSLGDSPRPYDPATDLIPLCPNCHRAIHSRRPLPWSPQELAGMIASA
ncbi:HNH endonuclease [Novosphingobium olei]|uniref:HNH endonuclease n=1 Tax=Novosphingobium olei TaxID=2728851 RepID=A0A7Y0BTH0_9SPHN|nr:HNH endonuclease [Novosphingobium olei]NML96138.1 HNH endonuclease [Novosphingobium olei]